VSINPLILTESNISVDNNGSVYDNVPVDDNIFVGNEVSEDGLSDFEDTASEILGTKYEMEVTIGKEGFTPQTSTCWKTPWANAVWRDTSGDKYFQSTDNMDKYGFPISWAKGRIYAAGLFIGNIVQKEPSKGSKAGVSTSRGPNLHTGSAEMRKKKSQRGEAQGLLDYDSDSSEILFSSSSLYCGERKDWKNIHDTDANDYWTFIKTPVVRIEDEWDMVPEAAQFGKSAARTTFNSLARAHFEVKKAEREAKTPEKSKRD
jgi:hypothetical protein